MSGGGGSKRFGLELKKKDEVGGKKPKIASAFCDEDSDEEREKAAPSASQRFDEKYASSAKRRDQKLLEKAIAEDPSIFEYDSIHEKLEKQRHKATIEQKEADKERKPKYAQNIINANKKRQLDQLLHDERTYKKEREAEGGAFDDKEAFVTDAYRQQMIERNKFREEQEKQDAMDARNKVENSSVWQSAFQHHMLNMTARVDESALKNESTDVTGEAEEKPIASHVKDPGVASSSAEVKKEKSAEDLPSSQRIARDRSPRRRSPPGDQTSSERERGKYPSRERQSATSSTTGRADEHPNRTRSTSQGAHKTPAEVRQEKESERDRERNQINQRMDKIKAILKKRNGEAEIEEAKKRYFERKEQGLIVPPLI